MEKDTEMVKFVYVRDSRCPERVLTLARKIVSGKLRVSWCMNKVSESTYVENSDGVRYRVRAIKEFDVFNKKKGRHIASERLSCDREGCWLEFPLGEKDRPASVMFTGLLVHPGTPKRVRKLLVRSGVLAARVE
jgi:hypothetical protein